MVAGKLHLVSSSTITKTDRLLAAVVSRVTICAVVMAALVTMAGFIVSRHAGVGAALGSGMSLGSLVLYYALTRLWLRPSPRRTGRVVAWLAWALKWPLLLTLLWWAVCRLQTNLAWLCIGVGVVPMAILMVAGWAGRSMRDANKTI